MLFELTEKLALEASLCVFFPSLVRLMYVHLKMSYGSCQGMSWRCFQLYYRERTANSPRQNTMAEIKEGKHFQRSLSFTPPYKVPAMGNKVRCSAQLNLAEYLKLSSQFLLDSVSNMSERSTISHYTIT